MRATETYKTMYWGFSFEALPTQADRIANMTALLAWCDALRPYRTFTPFHLFCADREPVHQHPALVRATCPGGTSRTGNRYANIPSNAHPCSNNANSPPH